MRTMKLLATVFLEGAQGMLETQKAPSLACWGREDQRLLGGEQAQGERGGSLARAARTGGEGPGGRPKQLLLAKPGEAVMKTQRSLLSCHLGDRQWENGKKTQLERGC